MNVTINAKNWKLRQYRDFIKATQTNDLDKIIELVPLLIEKWDLPGDPKDQDYVLDNLDLQQWIDVTKLVTVALTQEFAAPK